MAKRKRIGIFLLSPEYWTGGYYYSLNLIRCCNFLPEKKKPHLVVFYSDTQLLEEVKELAYPYIDFLPLQKVPSFFEKTKFFLGKLIGLQFPIGLYRTDIVSFLYPCELELVNRQYSLYLLKKIYWIPDFQEKYYPDFFSQAERDAREEKTLKLTSSASTTVVFSSETAFSDLKRYYPNYKNKTRVMRFASILPSFKELDLTGILAKYGIGKPYFISPNQFWVHKNHQVILEATLELKTKGIDFLVLFTGKESDYRCPQYTDDLKAFVTEHQLGDHVKFLGFIDRKEQLLLMKNAISIIQPSLFEGWSTVVEDTKAINHRLLLSNLSVHREQIASNVVFFDPRNAKELASKMVEQIQQPLLIVPYDYTEDIKAFAESLTHLDE
jgi:glycosyltransferase involved in cell wall biosynthesis